MSGEEAVEPTSETRPARGYSWPPFEVGNQAALTHGATSERVWSPLAEEIMASLLAMAAEPGSEAAYLLAPMHRPSVWAWAEATAKVQLLAEYIDQRDGLGLDGEGEPTGAAKLLLRWTKTAEGARDRLGLSPLAAAKLGRDVASAKLDMAALMAQAAAEEASGGG